MKKSTCKIAGTIAAAGIGLTLCSVIGYKLGYRKACGCDFNVYKQMCEIDPTVQDHVTEVGKYVDYSKI